VWHCVVWTSGVRCFVRSLCLRLEGKLLLILSYTRRLECSTRPPWEPQTFQSVTSDKSPDLSPRCAVSNGEIVPSIWTVRLLQVSEWWGCSKYRNGEVVPSIWTVRLFQVSERWDCSKYLNGETVPSIWTVRLFQVSERWDCSKYLNGEVVPSVWTVRLFQVSERWGCSKYLNGEIVPIIGTVRLFQVSERWDNSKYLNSFSGLCWTPNGSVVVGLTRKLMVLFLKALRDQISACYFQHYSPVCPVICTVYFLLLWRLYDIRVDTEQCHYPIFNWYDKASNNYETVITAWCSVSLYN
jgi:hypothetical protein